jgi:putative ABC transport system substrate-binding protein
MTSHIGRREFIALLGGAAAWPLAARAQQPSRMRRIGVLTPFPADDAEGHARLTAFTQAVQQSGWTVGQNVRMTIAGARAIPQLCAACNRTGRA